MKQTDKIVFLVDVDDTLLDNDRIQEDLKDYIEQEFGPKCRDQYWTLQEKLFQDLGYRDYLGAFQLFRVMHPYEHHLVTAANYLVDYPFRKRLYPRALDVLARLREWGRTVILTDGDVVFQPRKVVRSGIFKAVDGHVLIYVHKEAALADVQRRYPAKHYVVVDDKLRILDAIKKAWGKQVTTVFPCQGKFANDPKIQPAFPEAADVKIERIRDLLRIDFARVIGAKMK
ncbi:MAG TPA: HAD family hydrolase [Candidatus Sulfotelmatobacter sp.]|nr:HAD family hydrolase [Candidatus Sulfotelmatobacter sp.]